MPQDSLNKNDQGPLDHLSPEARKAFIEQNCSALRKKELVPVINLSPADIELLKSLPPKSPPQRPSVLKLNGVAFVQHSDGSGFSTHESFLPWLGLDSPE